MTTVHDFTVRTITGEDQPLSAFGGKVLLIVNTASQCGFTPQYAGLEELYREYRDRGLVILGFPCNQFGGQEPGDGAEIATFCRTTYAVDFPLFAKVEVNGPDAAPLFAWLKGEAPGLLGSRGIKWNFTKFLIDRAGRPVRRYAPRTKPEAIRRDIEKAL